MERATFDLEVRKIVFRVSVDGEGCFQLAQSCKEGKRLGGYVGRFDTLEKLRMQLMKRTKRASLKLDIHATTLDGANAVPIRIVGQNQGNHKLIVRVDGARREEWEPYTTVYRPLTTAETEEYAKLYTAHREASKALSKFVDAKKLDVRKLVAAEEAKLDAEAEAEAKAEPTADELLTPDDGATNADDCCGPVDGAAS